MCLFVIILIIIIIIFDRFRWVNYNDVSSALISAIVGL